MTKPQKAYFLTLILVLFAMPLWAKTTAKTTISPANSAHYQGMDIFDLE